MPRRALGLVAAVLGLVTAVACTSGEPTPAATPPPVVAPAPSPLRVMTWNLQRGQAMAGRLASADMGPFAARVSAKRADVLGVQEVTHDQASAIAELLGWPPPQYVETKNPCPDLTPPLPAACVPFGNAILSRYPLTEPEHWSLPPSGLEAGVEERVLLRSVATVDGRDVSVFVTHLASSATTREREAQVGAVLALIDDDRPSGGEPFRPVLLGDFNADPDGRVVARVTERFVDAWADVRGDAPGFTSNSTLTLTRRIDYVFVGRTSGLRPIAVSVDPEALSDHLPVVADLA